MVSTSPSKEDRSTGKWTEGDPARRAKWWYSTFHAVTAMIGAGVLSLPICHGLLGLGARDNGLSAILVHDLEHDVANDPTP
ncbi:hypothetical protein OIU74_018308 [Salix koriyanagi]|uniref:Amino acid transporter transmembrane domain-containing protein n=1 Tax=Salix koriyanagi TaxID=2511006 RepID=A0A9Q0WT50_9ROSI|nr:hypothetical protein OIU74_018308 [Salix koriyanagi]